MSDQDHLSVLGIDSAELSGFAVVVREHGREKLLAHGTIKICSGGDVVTAVEELARLPVDLVAIEAPYVGVNAATGLQLAVLLGRWTQEFERRGAAVVTAKASVWQMGILTGLISRHSPRDDRKRAAQLWAQATFGTKLSEDESDAAGLATHIARAHAFTDRCAGPQLLIGGLDPTSTTGARTNPLRR